MRGTRSDTPASLPLMNGTNPPLTTRSPTIATFVPRASRSGLLAAVASLMVSCASPTQSTADCSAHDNSFSAIKSRVVDASVFAAYEVGDCVSDIHEHDVDLHDEACSLNVKPGTKPEPPSGWERTAITFAPVVVRQMAEKRSIHIAILYSTSKAVQFYADDDLSRAIVYKQITSCDRA